MKNKLRIIIIVILTLISLLGLYRGIGYLIRASLFPTITNITINNEARFFGYYVLSGVWFIVFIVASLTNLIFGLKTRRKKVEEIE